MATIPLSIQQLLQQFTLEEIVDASLAVYQSEGSAVTSWPPFGTERTRVTAQAAGQALISQNYIPSITAGGYLPLALQVNPSWVPINAEQVYSTFPLPATTTQGYMQVYNSSGSTVNISSGDLLVQVAGTGNRYFNLNQASIPESDGYPSIVYMVAEAAGSKYNDPSNQVIELVNSVPGLAVTNKEDQSGNSFTSNHAGPSPGIITISTTGTAVNAYLSISIVVSGSEYNQTVYFKYSLNGSVLSDPVQIPGDGYYTVPGSGGLTVEFIDASNSIPANFYSGDSWQFVVPGDWKILIGTDVESNTSLAQRAIRSFNLQSDIPTLGYYERKVKETPIVGSQVSQVVAFPDGYVGGKINVVITQPDGYTSPQVVKAVGDYLNAFSPLTTNVVVFPPLVSSIDFVGTITVIASSGGSLVPPLPNIQASIQESILEYLASIPINGTIRLSKITSIIQNQAGVVEVAINNNYTGQAQLGIVQDGGSPIYKDLVLGNSAANQYFVGVAAVTGTKLFGFSYIVS